VAASLLSQVLAQETAVQTLRRALARDRVHHAYLFDGPDGVGKELAAFGLAQALVCEKRGTPEGPVDDACGVCRACVRAVPREGEGKPGGSGGSDRAPPGVTMHPDVVAIERGLYDPASIGRRTPEAKEISIDQVRTLVLARAAFAPHEGRAKVFVIRRVEELSIAAANALLKTLEEPNDRTHFVLLTAQPDALLPTIRSRTQRVRFAPLPDAVVTKLLAARGVDAFRAGEIARLAAGSMSAALSLADEGESAARERFVERAIAALGAPTLGAALDVAEEAKKEKGDLAIRLAALASALAKRACDTAGAGARDADVDAARYQLALAAVEQLRGNANPQLVVEAMLSKMRSL
jgi:DNA polymerase-3 subunit delta'